MKRLRWLLAVAWLATLVWTAPRAGAQAEQTRTLTPQAGQWLVCAASYTGPEAKDLANQLANWIQSKYNAPVYLYNRADEERKRLNEEYAKRGLKKGVRIEDQYAVLVGGYADLETAGKARDVVRRWPLSELKLASGKSPFDLETTFDMDVNGQQKAVTRPINPFTSAIPIRNPLTPKPTAQKIDPFLKQLNAGEDYSLLNNPRPWTLAVKQYTGGSIVTDQQNVGNPSFWDKLFGSKQGEALDAAGKQAHELARVLRKLGFQAWVLHTRGSSVVTVGGFDAVDDPEIEKMKVRISQLTQRVIESSSDRRDLFQLFAQPLPMEVPRLEK